MFDFNNLKCIKDYLLIHEPKKKKKKKKNIYIYIYIYIYKIELIKNLY